MHADAFVSIETTNTKKIAIKMVVKRKAMRDEKLISKQRTQDSHNVEKKNFPQNEAGGRSRILFAFVNQFSFTPTLLRAVMQPPSTKLKTDSAKKKNCWNGSLTIRNSLYWSYTISFLSSADVSGRLLSISSFSSGASLVSVFGGGGFGGSTPRVLS